MKNHFLKIRQYGSKVILTILAVLGFTAAQPCHKKNNDNKEKKDQPIKTEKRDPNEIKCMYGGPPSAYRRLDTTRIKPIDLRDTISTKEMNSNKGDDEKNDEKDIHN